jgi:hypothetical protein
MSTVSPSQGIDWTDLESVQLDRLHAACVLARLIHQATCERLASMV